MTDQLIRLTPDFKPLSATPPIREPKFRHIALALAIKFGSLRPAFVLHATANAIAGFGSVFDRI
jgi:hypothetical protein